VDEGVDDVSEDEGPGAPQAVLHLAQQQADQQVVHQQDAVALVRVGGPRRALTHRQQDPLDGDLGPQRSTTEERKERNSLECFLYLREECSDIKMQDKIQY